MGFPAAEPAGEPRRPRPGDAGPAEGGSPELRQDNGPSSAAGPAQEDAIAEVAAGRSPADQRASRPRRRWAVALVLTLMVFAGLGFAAAWARAQVYDPVNQAATARVLVHVAPGMRLGQIADMLQRQGLVRSALAFRLLAIRDGRSRSLQAGTYALGPFMTPRQILLMLAQGQVASVRLTIPEGWDARQVVAGIAAADLGAGSELARAVDDPSLLTATGLPAPAPGVITALEGYLFPTTYAFPPDATARQVLGTMLQRFTVQWTPALADAARSNAGLSTAQAVTLASIVQREVADPTEMPVVAGIYLHRLQLGMKLDADPTVLYALGIEAQDTPLSASELGVDSPYNTYRYGGLPPGPIANPGQQALEAVAHPMAVDAVYFLTTPDGRLVLARTLAEQLANRKRYLGY